MLQYLKTLVRASFGLVAAMAMAAVAHASVVVLPARQPGSEILLESNTKRDLKQAGRVAKKEYDRLFLLTQKKEPVPEKPQSPPAPAAEPDKMKQPDAPAPRMEKNYEINRSGDLERAGTRKLGGEIIRHKDE
jgi:hypothetical protein